MWSPSRKEFPQKCRNIQAEDLGKSKFLITISGNFFTPSGVLDRLIQIVLLILRTVEFCGSSQDQQAQKLGVAVAFSLVWLQAGGRHTPVLLVWDPGRYITVEVNFENKHKQKLETKDLVSEIQRAVQTLHGDFGCGAIRRGLAASYCHQLTGIAIVRCRLGPHKLICSALPFITRIGQEKVNVRMLHVGGTLRHCYKRILVHQKGELAKLTSKVPTGVDEKELEKELLTIRGFGHNNPVTLPYSPVTK